MKICSIQGEEDRHLNTYKVETWMLPHGTIAIQMKLLILKSFLPVVLHVNPDIIMLFVIKTHSLMWIQSVPKFATTSCTFSNFPFNFWKFEGVAGCRINKRFSGFGPSNCHMQIGDWNGGIFFVILSDGIARGALASIFFCHHIRWLATVPYCLQLYWLRMSSRIESFLFLACFSWTWKWIIWRIVIQRISMDKILVILGLLWWDK